MPPLSSDGARGKPATSAVQGDQPGAAVVSAPCSRISVCFYFPSTSLASCPSRRTNALFFSQPQSINAHRLGGIGVSVRFRGGDKGFLVTVLGYEVSVALDYVPPILEVPVCKRPNRNSKGLSQIQRVDLMSPNCIIS